MSRSNALWISIIHSEQRHHTHKQILPFNYCESVFCRLIKGLIPEVRMLCCFVLNKCTFQPVTCFAIEQFGYDGAVSKTKRKERFSLALEFKDVLFCSEVVKGYDMVILETDTAGHGL